MNKKQIIKFMNEKNFYPSKKMGQNFLLSDDYKKRIVDAADIKESDFVLEIGAGFGAISDYIISKTKNFTIIEFDKRLFEFLLNKFNDSSIELINSDILKVDINNLLNQKDGTSKKVISNLPYSISSQVIINLIKSKNVDDMFLMVQTEMANRIISKPNSKKYNGYTVLINLLADVKKLFDVPPTVFYPEPNVYSTVIQITPKKTSIDIESIEKFLKLLFSEKRKKISNNLKKNYSIDKLTKAYVKCNIQDDVRAEQLSPQQILSLYEELM